MPCKIISLAQQKGGVGKTTTVINLGSALAQRGKKVLLVDLDPQGALSAGLGLNPLSLEKTIYNVLRSSSASLAEIITQSKTGCDLVPANIDLAAAEVELVSEPGREHFLREALAPVTARYDYILIDCQPSLGLLTLNALSASSGVIIPVQTQYFALRGMDLLFQTIEKVQARLNPKLKIIGILPTMYDARTIHAREVLEELKRAYPKLILSAVVPHTIKFADSSMAGDSVLSLNPDSQAAKAYRELAMEVEKRV
jgi:chromosome partitioning protein